MTVSKDHITIEGASGAILDGSKLTGDTGITVAAKAPATTVDGFTLLGMTIRNYSENGVFLNGVQNFRIAAGIYSNNGEYGIFPIFSTVRNNVSQGTVAA